MLALDPTNREAFDALQTEAREVRHIQPHGARRRDAGIDRQLYYGDRSRSEVIWETNQFPANSETHTGDDFEDSRDSWGSRLGAQGSPEPAARTAPILSGTGIKPEPAAQEEVYVNPMLAEARERSSEANLVGACNVDNFWA